MSRIYAWSIWTLVHSAPSLGHLCILVCLNVLITVHLGHLLMCSSTFLQYSGHQAYNLNFVCVAATSPGISSFTLLIMSLLKIWGGTIASALYIMPLSSVPICYLMQCLFEKSLRYNKVTPYILSYVFKYSA